MLEIASTVFRRHALRITDEHQDFVFHWSGRGGGGADPEARYESGLILKTVIKSCHKYKGLITLFAPQFMCI
jgi:hypothetical protein